MTFAHDMCRWLSLEFTPKNKWLGGFVDPTSRQPVYSKDRLREVMEANGFVKVAEEQVPALIREHKRKFQYIVSEATGWRKEGTGTTASTCPDYE